MSKNIPPTGIDPTPGEKLKLVGCSGNNCISNIVTGTVLAEYLYTEKSGDTIRIPAIVSNIYGEGRVVHLYFHVEQVATQLDSILEKTFNWLLRIDTLPQDYLKQDT